MNVILMSTVFLQVTQPGGDKEGVPEVTFFTALTWVFPTLSILALVPT